jgi:ATP adenylyltransferase
LPERMWAPWRMSYILGEKQGACVFCDIAAAPVAAYRAKLVLVMQEHALVCLNRYPFAASHLLVLPRRHVSALEDLPPEEYDALMRLVREATTRLKQVTQPEGVNLGFNLGKAAGAGIAEHLHAHVVPRWNGDTNFMPVLGDVRIMPEMLDDSWRRLAPAFADVPGEHAAVDAAPGPGAEGA